MSSHSIPDAELERRIESGHSRRHNVLKPFMTILGMFIGATLFALGYRVFMAWVADAHEEGGEDASAELR